MKRVLFICTANSARSQVAEAVLRARAGDRFEVFSAGTDPADIDPRALAALLAAGIATDGLHAKSVDSLRGQHFDFIISLCREARDECARWPGSGVQLAWDLIDPVSSAEPQAFARTLQQVEQRVSAFVSVMTDSVSGDEQLEPEEFFRLLADPIRLKSLLLIRREGELCVYELMAALDEPQPKVSRNLALLRKAGVLLDRRQGQWVFYRLHPMLREWALQTLQAVESGHQDYLSAALARLGALSDRPKSSGDNINGNV